MSSLSDSLNGWLIVDKPRGVTSTAAVTKVKRLLRPAKIGHAGTLDPLASGILPLALGEATKAVSLLMDAKKTYQFTVRWGEERSTDDEEGIATATSALRPSLSDIESLLPEFTGLILQTPPVYSAIKLQGKPAYARARQGETPELKSRTVEVLELAILHHREDETAFFLKCGKGTYVRALARDMGRKLGCFGYISELRRLSVGKFGESSAISLDNLESLLHTPPPESGDSSGLRGLWSVESVLDDIPALEADSLSSRKLKTGVALPAAPFVPFLGPNPPETVCVLHAGKLQALARVESGWLKPVRVFNH